MNEGNKGAVSLWAAFNPLRRENLFVLVVGTKPFLAWHPYKWIEMRWERRRRPASTAPGSMNPTGLSMKVGVMTLLQICRSPPRWQEKHAVLLATGDEPLEHD